ncbi:MAG: MG2 domain-containing protein, partial [Planctomycetota bacterium]
MNERRREALRQELLELHFGCHADPDGLQARIDADPALQALAAEVRQEALLLEAAASEPTRELDLPEPKAWPPRKEVVIWHKRPLVRITAALVLGILLVPTGLWLVNRVRHDLLERSATRLELAGPSGFPDGAPARYTIRTTDFQGEDREREVVWRLFDEHGEKKSSGSLMSTGTATLELPAQLGGPRRLEVALADSPETAAASLYLSPAAESPLIHLTTDKPVYRPGEQVYMRGVLLDRLSLEPRENSYRLRIVGPRDRVEQDTIVQSREGVLAPRFLLPPEAPGGEYAVELRDRDNQFAVERRTFLVQRFEAPRFEKRIDLDRKTYAPGESGSAEVTIARLGQGPAAGAQLDASVIVDGEVIWKNQSTLDEAGRAIFSFQVPGEVARGEGRFVARVSDGSVVESDIEPFVIPLDRLEVSFFPEGGSLVAGTENRVYAEVTDPLGRAVEAEGRIVDSKNRTVHSFKTEHQGRARFTYSPEVGERYQLRFESPSAEASDLPKAEASGVTLRAKADSFAPGAPVAAEVHTTDPGLWIAGVFCRGTLVGQTTFHGAGNHDLEIDLGPEATGVLRLTVFRRDLLPVAERLVRRESDRGIAIRVEPEYETIVPGEHQKLTVHTTDESGEPVSAVLGVSVIDSATRDILDEPRIGLLEQALFFADVEELEDIEDFVTTDADSARHIDLVLGTRGWRRFGWLKPDELIAEHGDAARRVLIREGRPGLPRVAQKMLLSGGAQPELLGELDRRARS